MAKIDKSKLEQDLLVVYDKVQLLKDKSEEKGKIAEEKFYEMLVKKNHPSVQKNPTKQQKSQAKGISQETYSKKLNDFEKKLKAKEKKEEKEEEKKEETTKKVPFTTQVANLSKAKGITFGEAKVILQKEIADRKKAEEEEAKVELNKLFDIVKSEGFEAQSMKTPTPFPKQFGKAKGSKSNIGSDSKRQALAVGKRISQPYTNKFGKHAGGKTYYEYRENRVDRNSLTDRRGGKYKYQGVTPPFLKSGGLLDSRERYLLELEGLSGVRKSAIEKYVAENNLTDNDILNIIVGLGRKQLKGTDVVTAIIGKKDNVYSKKLIAFCKENKAMKLEDGGSLDAYYEAGGTLPTPFGQAGLVGETGTLNEVDLFCEGGMMPQGVHQFFQQSYLPSFPTPYGYKKGGKVKQQPKMVRGFSDDEAYEYEDGGKTEFNLVGNYYYDSRKDKTFQIYYEDRNKIKIQYIDKYGNFIGNMIDVPKSEFEYNVSMGSWGKYKQPFVGMAKGGQVKPKMVRGFADDEAYEYAKGGVTKDSIVRTLTSDKSQYFLEKDNDGYILYISPRGAMNSTFHDKFDVEDLGNEGTKRKYRLKKKANEFADGGKIDRSTEMVLSQNKAISHHTAELKDALKKDPNVEPWVIGKMERAETDISDVTHYLDGRSEYADGGMMPQGIHQYFEETYLPAFPTPHGYANGGQVKWQDAKFGDSALVVSENKMGIIIKPYGRKFHLKFVDGTEKTYDASELQFIKDEDEYAKGGEVTKIYTEENQYRLGRPSGSIEKDILDRVSHEEADFVGSFGWRTDDNRYADGYLYKLDDFDKNYVKDVKLKDGEHIFRYFNRGIAISGMRPLIKININKGLIYFLADLYDYEEKIIFDTKGVKAIFINLIQDRFAKGGKVLFKEKAKAIAKNFEGKKVEPKYQKEYGKTYSKEEAKEVGNKIAGSQKAMYDSKLAKGGVTRKKYTKKNNVMFNAKMIRRKDESWYDALRRASAMK